MTGRYSLIGVESSTPKELPLAGINLYFSALGNIGGKFIVAVGELQKEPLIAMDILAPLGIIIRCSHGAAFS